MTQNNAPSESLVVRYSRDLSGPQRSFLRGLGHHLNPIVHVGQRGISENLLENVEAGLLSHELIKVKVHDADMMEDAMRAIHASTRAQLVQKIGKNLLLWRAHPEEPSIKLP